MPDHELIIKRHILVDWVGLLLHALVHPMDIQGRDGGVLLLSTLSGMSPFLTKLFADAGDHGPQSTTAVARSCLAEVASPDQARLTYQVHADTTRR